MDKQQDWLDGRLDALLLNNLQLGLQAFSAPVQVACSPDLTGLCITAISGCPLMQLLNAALASISVARPSFSNNPYG